jgi:hypothetical protein
METPMIKERLTSEKPTQNIKEKSSEYTKPTLSRLGTVSSLTAGNQGSIADVSSPGTPPTQHR